MRPTELLIHVGWLDRKPYKLKLYRGKVRPAFSMVELLSTLALLGLLIAMILPAVQAARESSRVSQCQNNIRHISLGLLIYHHIHGSFPHGGWGHAWVGVPERGRGKGQPGGWAYSSLPYLDEEPLHSLGSGSAGVVADELYSERLKTPLPLFVCPGRRSCSNWPVDDRYPWVNNPKPFGKVTFVARADYAINSGTSHVFSFSGPADLKMGDDATFWSNAPNPRTFTGISHLRTSCSLRSVLDGASKTYLVGEKYVDSANYASGTSEGDNESLYAGYCTDLHRFAGIIEQLKISLPPFAAPLRDSTTPTEAPRGFVCFGSAHASGFNMGNCDGSVRLIEFDVDPVIHFRGGHRRDDGKPVDSVN